MHNEETEFSPIDEATRCITECAQGTRSLTLLSSGELRAGAYPCCPAIPQSVHNDARAHVHIVAELLDGDTIDISLGRDGVSATFRAVGGLAAKPALTADSIHELLMQVSPMYGAWYLTCVSESLRMNDDDDAESTS